MSIMIMEPAEGSRAIRQAGAAQVGDYRRYANQSRMGFGAVWAATEQQYTQVPIQQGSGGGLLSTTPSFLDTWGIPIAAGAGGLLIGVLLAKLMMKKKR